MFFTKAKQLFLLLTIILNVYYVDSFEINQPTKLIIPTESLTDQNQTLTHPLNFDLKKNQHQEISFTNIQKGKVEVLSKLLKIHVDDLRSNTDEVELVFLVDASASVGLQNFQSELSFVRKLLSDFTVAPAATRVAVVTFAGKASIIRHVDQISSAGENNHKCRLLNQQLGNITYSGGGTYTRGALLEALDILERSRSGSRKAVFLITDGFSNGGDPRPAATMLKQSGVVVFTFGIRTGNIEELHQIATEPGYTYSYLLDSFPEFEALARRALHHDLKAGDYVTVDSLQDCDLLCSGKSRKENTTQCCDTNASCACGIATGHYACLCHPGYFGSGFYGSCEPCPNGTFGIGNIPGDSKAVCVPCPDINHVTIKSPATASTDCICAAGFTTNGNKCEAITCPKLRVPENGYLVKASACNNVLNAACGIRCKIGFHLTGDSIRLCRKGGAWSGTEPQCLVKTCPALKAPIHGSIRCEHEDERHVINPDLSAYPIDTHCEYKCDVGYQLRGSRARNCLPVSRWDGLKVSCRPIQCQPLKSVPNGEISPESCTGFDKLAFGTNCTMKCKPGFTRKGPEHKVCAGRTGSWSHRRSVTQCIDNTPPSITCPLNITTETLPGKSYAVANWTEAVATDNAEIEPTVWSEPFITALSEIEIGNHVIAYIAQDASKNKAECYFGVTVLDREPPTVENCVDPPIFLLETNTGVANITWDEPVFYDNSGLPVKISRSHVPGEDVFRVGATKVVYSAMDNSNNTKTCILNITIEDACEDLPSPVNGQSDCASLQDGVQCVLTCSEGYAFVLPQPDTNLNDENVTLMCSKDNHLWNNNIFPDCSVTQVPYAIAQDLTVLFNANTSNCKDPEVLDTLSRDIKTGLESQLLDWCENDLECDISQSDLICEDQNGKRIALVSSTAERLNPRSRRHASLHSHRVAQRQATANRVSNSNSKNRTKKRSGQKMDKIEVKYKIIGKILENNRNNPKQAITKLREKFDKLIKNGQLNILGGKTNQEIANLTLNLDIIFEEARELCHAGSVLKRRGCVKCPLGTFHNTTKKQCQSCRFGEYQDEPGSPACKKCPEYKSTRKMHSSSLADCINLCRPGYYSRRKRHHKSTLALEPCVTCAIGFYQSAYAQSKCLPCPQNTTTVARGASSIDECLAVNDTDVDPCSKNPCLNGGSCVKAGNDFSCKCAGDFIGSLCEVLPNPCDSSPCLNEGQCIVSNSSNVLMERKCLCKNGYTGVNCETYIDECLTDPCQNNGRCMSTEEDFECVCQNGFEGEVCEIEINHCDVSPCEAGSNCSSVNATWQCECKPGYLGRRCSRLPCDWLPCHANSICVNIEEINATKESYRCECPEGYTGENCTTMINYCEDSPCMNNGTCVNNLSNYTCECRKGYNGSNCETELSSAYMMNFPRSGTTDYVIMDGPKKNLSQFTVCLWLQSVDTINYGTVLSYATHAYDNALTLTDYNGFVIYINGNRVVTDITANDGYWHFVCITWENVFGSWNVFVDGVVKDNGTFLAIGMEIEGNGTLVIGQEQDLIGGGFSESESLLGKLSLLDVWDEVLSDEVIKDLGTLCESYHGSLYSWAELRGYIRGNIEVENSTFCTACELPAAPSKGSIEPNSDSSEIVYSCEDGHLVKYGKKENSTLTRRCLKQRQWEGYYTPTCTKVRCGFPGYFPRGHVHGRSYTYGDQILYSCNQGAKLRGNPHRICTADGTWSGIQPLCIGTTCRNLLAPDNGDVEYLIEEYERDDVSILQVGHQLEFKCNSGFRILGEALLTCQESGEWDNAVPQCIAFGCPPPEPIDNGYIASNISTGIEMLPQILSSSKTESSFVGGGSMESGHLYGDIVGFSCREGYKFRGNHNLIEEFRIQCTNNGSWIGVVPDCVPLHCPRPDPIKNAKSYLLSVNKTLTEIMRNETFGNLTFINKLVPIIAQPSPNFDGPFDIPISTDELHDLNSSSSLTKRNTMPEEFQAEFNDSFVLGAQISIICNKGFELIGESVRTCTNNETWSPETPRCEPVRCEVEEHPLINILIENEGGINWDSEMTEVPASGEIMKTFKENKKLRGELENFAFVSNGSIFGDTVSLTCLNDTKIDFKDVGIGKSLEKVIWTCDEDGKWEFVDREISGDDLQRVLDEEKEALCKETTCNSPKVPTNGYLVNGKTNSSLKRAGDVVRYKCRHGFNLKGGDSAKCLPNGTWTSIPNCESVTCGKPPTPLNAALDDSSAEATGYVFGNMVSYWCLSGYKMYGRGSARCLANGKWSRMSGRCSRISCGKPAVPPGVKMLGPSYLYQDHLTYVCPDNTTGGKITCKSDGKWSEFPDCSTSKS